MAPAGDAFLGERCIGQEIGASDHDIVGGAQANGERQHGKGSSDGLKAGNLQAASRRGNLR